MPMSELSDRNLIFDVASRVVTATLDFLRSRGEQGDEGVILWPGGLLDGACHIAEPLIPAQITGPRFYQIPDAEVFRIIQWLARRKLVIPIQVHSHEKHAFHSWADDEYAFVQHENAISVVVPLFGNISNDEFLTASRFYRLDEAGEWVEVESREISRRFLIEGA